MNPLMAARAYAAVQGGAGAGETTPAAGPGFGEMLQNVMGSMT